MPDDLRRTERPTFDPDGVKGQRIATGGTIHPPSGEYGAAAQVPPGALQVGELLGEGGMGRVFTATEPALGRHVAVKRVREARDEDLLALEARIAASLEHPNVVPVYGLQRSSDGTLDLVMRRVGGQRWSELLWDEEAAGEAARGQDLLGFHIGVLMQVCDAVALAHDRGILHRDLKPDNVMVGTFGQVYLVDWGIAVALRDDGHGFPLAADVKRVSGTPAYMAPEQALGRGDLFGPATDVYLLGAILCEILSGEPPHPGPDRFLQLEHAAMADAPELANATVGLREVAHRALQFRPHQRYASVAEMRDGLRTWLEERASEGLLTRSKDRLNRLTELLRVAFAGERVDNRELYALLTEARFGFRQVLESQTWRPAAIEGLQRAAEMGIRYEIFRENPEGARALLAELPEPRPDLAEQVADLSDDLSRQGHEVASLRELRQEMDLGRGAWTRSVLALVLGVILGLLCVVLAAFDVWVQPVGYTHLLAGVVAFDIALVVGTAVWSLSANRANRQLARMLAVMAVGITMHWVGAALTGMSIPDALSINALLSAAALGVGAAVGDVALLAGAFVYLITWMGVVVAPELALWTFGVGTGLSFTVYGLANWLTSALRR